jgi:L-malate glycosyltransferase
MSRVAPKKTVNVLYLIDSLAYGGAELQLLELIRNLDPERFRPHLCTLKESNSLFGDLDIPKLNLGYMGFTHLSILKNVKRLSRFITENRIDIIQTFFQDPFLLAAMVKPLNRVKLVGTFLDLGFWRTPVESLKMRMAYPFFSGFIANSQAVKDHFVETDRISAAKVVVICNGLNLSAIPDPASHHQAARSPVVGIVANLNRPVKRVQDFVTAASLVLRQVPGARFLVVGGGHLRDELESQAASLGLGTSIRFTGVIGNPLEVINTFDIGVLTSESEGLSNAIMEYMACGVPVVVTDVGGNPELVCQGVNGFLVPVGQPEQLAERIVQLIEDPQLLCKMGQINRAKIIGEYSLPVMLENQCAYYHDLLAGP